MRIIILIAFCIEPLFGEIMEWTRENRRIEAAQVTHWESKLEDAQRMSPVESVTELSLGLRNMGHRTEIEGHSPAVDMTYHRLQQIFLSIPSHASYLENVIEKERQKVEGVAFNSGPRIDYDFNRRLVFETLTHLPSPEAVMVLGEYLSDERDLHELTAEHTEGESCITGGSTGNATYSTKALERSALRDKPYRAGTVYDNKLAKAAWLAWWEKIKSGDKAFSFKGQTVEYRLAPDGTVVETPISIPSDELAAQEAEALALEKARKQPAPTEAPAPEALGNSIFPSIGAAVALLLVSLWWIFSAARRKEPKN